MGFAQIFHFVWLCLVVLLTAFAPHARARARVAPPQFFFSGKLVLKFELLINTLITYKPTTLWFVALATLATFLKVRARSSRALVLRAVRAVCGCQFAVGLFVCLCFVLNGVRPLGGGGALAPACPAFVRCPRGSCGALAPALRAVSATRFPPPPFGFAPPWLAVLGSRRGWSSPRSACAMRRLARPSSRQPRPRSVRPALRVRPSAPAPALAARSSCLSAFRWCVLLWRSPRAALRCGECPLCSCRLLRFRFVCLLCDIPPRALFVRAPRAMFAVVSSRLFLAFPPRPRPPSRSFLALLCARARSSRVRLLVPLRFTRAGRFDCLLTSVR